MFHSGFIHSVWKRTINKAWWKQFNYCSLDTCNTFSEAALYIYLAALYIYLSRTLVQLKCPVRDFILSSIFFLPDLCANIFQQLCHFSTYFKMYLELCFQLTGHQWSEQQTFKMNSKKWLVHSSPFPGSCNYITLRKETFATQKTCCSW